MYAAKFGYPFEKMQYYGTVDTEGKNIGPDTWWQSEDARKRVMAEIERIGKYLERFQVAISKGKIDECIVIWRSCMQSLETKNICSKD